MGQYHFNESFYADLENKITVKNEPYPHAFIKNFLPDSLSKNISDDFRFPKKDPEGLKKVFYLQVNNATARVQTKKPGKFASPSFLFLYYTTTGIKIRQIPAPKKSTLPYRKKKLQPDMTVLIIYY